MDMDIAGVVTRVVGLHWIAWCGKGQINQIWLPTTLSHRSGLTWMTVLVYNDA